MVYFKGRKLPYNLPKKSEFFSLNILKKKDSWRGQYRDKITVRVVRL
jgi:hypothetical protein